jgi:hypothetical protein
MNSNQLFRTFRIWKFGISFKYFNLGAKQQQLAAAAAEQAWRQSSGGLQGNSSASVKAKQWRA